MNKKARSNRRLEKKKKPKNDAVEFSRGEQDLCARKYAKKQVERGIANRHVNPGGQVIRKKKRKLPTYLRKGKKKKKLLGEERALFEISLLRVQRSKKILKKTGDYYKLVQLRN